MKKRNKLNEIKLDIISSGKSKLNTYKENSDKSNEETECNKRKQLPLGPGKVFLTLLSLCIFLASMSGEVAWLIGYRYSILLLYLGVFSFTLMVLVDVKSMYQYLKNKRK